MAQVQIVDEILPSKILYENGKRYTEDATYVLRFKTVSDDGIVKEYGRRRSDNNVVMINIEEVLRKIQEKRKSVRI